MTTEAVIMETKGQATERAHQGNSANGLKTGYQPAYPIEQPFKLPLVASAMLVLLPALLIYWFWGDSSTFPRSLKLFFGNWISPIILWFFAASFFHLILKRGKLRNEQRQTRLLSQRLLPTVMAESDADASPVQLSQQLHQTAISKGMQTNNLLLTRLMLFLNHQENDVDETFGIKERELMRGSYSLSRFMVWAIPIMGFIGTVWGISNGIAHFSSAMTATSSVGDVSAMLKENLPLVTNSLATAFDTTLLALLLSIPLMMIMIWLEKQEESYLIDLEENWFHLIKPKLVQHYPLMSAANGATVGAGVAATDSGDREAANQVANEIKLLSTQIKALQETMEDLYETVFASKLGKK